MNRIRATKFPKKYDLFWVNTNKFKKWPNDSKPYRPFLIAADLFRDHYRVVPVTTELPYKNIKKYKNNRKYLYIKPVSLDYYITEGKVKAKNKESVAVIKACGDMVISLFDKYHGTLNDYQKKEFDSKIKYKGKNQ